MFFLLRALCCKVQRELAVKESSILVLYSNTNILEACFSLMRTSKGDTALKYARMVGTLDTRHQLMAIESNQCMKVILLKKITN